MLGNGFLNVSRRGSRTKFEQDIGLFIIIFYFVGTFFPLFFASETFRK